MIQDGRPAGVQKWSWNGALSNPYGLTSDGCGGLRRVSRREFVEKHMTGPKRAEMLALYAELDKACDETDTGKIKRTLVKLDEVEAR